MLHVFNQNALVKFNLTVDSRSIPADAAYVGIPGKRYDPLDHLDELLQKGISLYVFQNEAKVLEKIKQAIKEYPEKLFLIVEDCVSYLQELASKHVRDWQKRCDGKLLAITGSNGKTTTKEMTFHLLNSFYPNQVIATEKNYNNHLGVPLTILRISDETKFALVEFGSNHPGEMEVLCQIANPNLGITTNIGATHLEFFDGLFGVFKEEAFIYQFLQDNQREAFFLNKDDEYLKKLSSTNNVITYGTEENCDFQLKFEASDFILKTKDQRYLIENGTITGIHNFTNLGIACVMTHYLSKNDWKEILSKAKTFKPTKNRSQWLSVGSTKVFLDAYNANPTSMRVAIDGFLHYLEQNQVEKDKTLIILGEMMELGDDSKKYHLEISKYLSDFPEVNKIFIGKNEEVFKQCNPGIITLEEVTGFTPKEWEAILQRHSHVMLKGSRSLQLESIIDIT